MLGEGHDAEAGVAETFGKSVWSDDPVGRQALPTGSLGAVLRRVPHDDEAFDRSSAIVLAT